MNPITIAAIYRFVSLKDYKKIKEPLLNLMLENDIKGTLLLAEEGINGTVAGRSESIEKLLDFLRKDLRLKDYSCKFSYDTEVPFYRTRVKLKKEIVTMGIPGIDPLKSVGTYIKPEDWNDLISDPEVVLFDTRNEYETNIGTFKNAVIPKTKSFRQFPDFIKENADPKKHKKVAMFCTGGIRCEKSTAYLKELGFEEVYHLQGGILNYFEKVPESESMWEGECFVFDNRVTVNHALERGDFDQCHACRMPITEDEKKSEHYTPGVSCPHCYDKTSEKQKERFLQRQRQMELSKNRGEQHIGSEANLFAIKRREDKLNKRNRDKEAVSSI